MATLPPLGIRDNLSQFSQQLLQVFFVGLTLGMTRTVVPALAESEFGVPQGSFVLLATFVIAFGFVKGVLNFVAGRMSERLGRKRVLFYGWMAALPIPWMIYYAPDWSWIVAATVLLGINQGFAWSMTQTAKLDITRADQRGLTLGLNEFSGYVGVAVAGIVTGYLAIEMGARDGLLVFGVITILIALVSTVVGIRETLPWAQSRDVHTKQTEPQQTLSTWEVFTRVSWQDKRLFAVTQAGLVEKFVDALVWIFYPVYFYQQGVSLVHIGWIVGIYGFVWGGSQIVTGRLSDRIGRKKPIVWGMWICGAGVGLTLFTQTFMGWCLTAAITGFGMALLYPNLSAAVADIAKPEWRGSAIGIYRFWRDLGYGIGAILLGVIAYQTGIVATGFWFTALAMFVSGAIVAVVGKETHPGIVDRR